MKSTRTKIICTIGPSSDKPAMLSSLMKAGMRVARLNFSHGTHAEHAVLMSRVRAAAKKINEPIAILADLQGPKIRLGILPEKGIEMKTGQDVIFTTGAAPLFSEEGTGEVTLPVTYAALHRDIKVGERFLVEDGIYEFRVTAIKGKNIHAKVVNGGKLFSHKGMNFPDSTLKISSLTEKDRDDAKFAVGKGVDWVALSFVTNPEDVKTLRRIVHEATPKGKTSPRIIVKIEKHEAIDRFDEILEVTDGVMVARGDLGVEISAEDVPEHQKMMIEKCRLAGKPVVVATQMLDSMIRNPRPTRAEVSDVANAVFDHTDCVMLSGETASGLYPLEAVSMMSKIVREAEASPYDDIPLEVFGPDGLANQLKEAADEKKIQGVLGLLELAPWSEHLFINHPEVPLYLAVPNEELQRQNVLRWAVEPFVLKNQKTKTAVTRALKILKEKKWISKKDRLAVVPSLKGGKAFEVV